MNKKIKLNINGSISNGDQSLAYYPTPKVGCTTVKTIIMNLLGDNRAPSKEIQWPHDVYRHPKFDSSIDMRICIVREPVQRFLSGYVNRVLYAKEIPEISIDQFIDEFYLLKKKHWTINHHFSPQVSSIGKNLNFYTKIFNLNQMDEVFELFSNFSDLKINNFKTQTSNDIPKPTLSSKQIETVRSFYKIDYELIGSFF